MLGRAGVVLLVVACLLAGPRGNASAAGTPGWALQRLPVPSSAQTFSLSCSASTACTAVATYYPPPFSGRDVLLALRWNGREWSRAVMPQPADSGTVIVSAIACPSASSCVAVGGSAAAPASPYVPLVERWNGARWSVEPAPAPARSGVSSRLTGVSCTSAVACTAVGQSASRDSRRPTRPLVERWNGTTWSIQRTSGPPLVSVSCTSGRACTAVSNSATKRFGEEWDGRRWSIEPSPHPRGFGGPNGENELTGVSCAARDACTAVGYSAWGGGFNTVRITLAEYWDGSHWSVQSTPSPSQPDELKSVSCQSGSACVAVGDGTDPAGDATMALVERWQGGHWSVVPTPHRLSTGKSTDSALESVACFAKGGCVAVGDAEGGPFALEFLGSGAPAGR